MKKPNKKALCILLTVLMAFSVLGCGESDESKAQSIYNAFTSVQPDNNLLSDSEKSKINEYNKKREALLKNSDIEGLEKLKKEWEDFVVPINDIYGKYIKTKEAYIPDSYKSYMTDTELQQNGAIIEKIESAYNNRNQTALSLANDEYTQFCKGTKDVIDAYTSINRPSFTEKEKSLLPKSDIDKMQQLSQTTQKALDSRDLQQLQSLKSDWQSYSETANTNLESAKHKMLNDWMLSSNVGASISNLLTFGTITSSATIENHKIIYSYKYNVDYGSKEQVEASLNSYLNLTSSIFQAGVSQLKPYVSDICIRLEYLDKNGDVICCREFK